MLTCILKQRVVCQLCFIIDKENHKHVMFGPRGRGLGVWTRPEKSQSIEFLSNTGADPLKNHKATKPAFNVGPSSAFKWRFAGGPMIVLSLL